MQFSESRKHLNTKGLRNLLGLIGFTQKMIPVQNNSRELSVFTFEIFEKEIDSSILKK